LAAGVAALAIGGSKLLEAQNTDGLRLLPPTFRDSRTKGF
jgi:hypothetical protein